MPRAGRACSELNAKARDAGTDSAAARTIAVFSDEGAAGAVATKLPVVTIDRTHNHFGRYSADTWLIASGPHLEPSAGGAFHFPYHPAITPVFVGWACADVDLLAPDAVAYMAAYGPVGCADATTRQILTAVGVPAFMSGPRTRLNAVAASALEAVVTALEAGRSADDVLGEWRTATTDAVQA